jgi:hypothetical protein
MLQFFGILLAAVLLFRLKGRSTTVPSKTVNQAPVIPRPMMSGADSIEGLNLPQAPALPVAFDQYNPKNNGFETPPIIGGIKPFSTF